MASVHLYILIKAVIIHTFSRESKKCYLEASVFLFLLNCDKVGPLLLDSLQFAIKKFSLGKDQRNSFNFITSKKGSVPLNCSSYRPISLI